MSLRFKKQGFTLIEILIAIFILMVVLSTIYAAYTGTFRTIKGSEYGRESYAMARSTMERFINDLGAISAYKGIFEFMSRQDELSESEFMGISFKATSHIVFGDQDISGGLASIDYYVKQDEKNETYSLMRSDVLPGDSDTNGMSEGGFVICERVQSLKFRFYDDTGKEYDFWDSKSQTSEQANRAPSIVSISLSMLNPDDKEHPYNFTTKVYLPVNRGE